MLPCRMLLLHPMALLLLGQLALLQLLRLRKARHRADLGRVLGLLEQHTAEHSEFSRPVSAAIDLIQELLSDDDSSF